VLERAWQDAAELVRRIQSGDAEAEADLVRRYRRGVTAIVAKAGRGRVPVEDLCQEVLAAAIEKIRGNALRGPERLSGYIAGLARIMVIDFLRKEQSRSEIETRIPPRETRQPPDGDRRLLEEEQAALVRSVLAELDSERDRQILLRFYLREDAKEEICRDLDLTAVHFNRVLHRARERFRALYRRRAERAPIGRPR